MEHLPEQQRRYITLRRLLTEYFNESELKTLCFDLHIDYDSLPDQGKANKARELVAYVQRHGRTGDLVDEARRLRPHVEWPVFAQPGLLQGPPADPAIIDPCLEYQIYYLAYAAGDRQEQEAARQQAFAAELQRAADALHRWLELPPRPVALADARSADPAHVTLRYSSGRLQRADGAAWGWLIASQVSDSYLLRLVAERPGRHLQPTVFRDLQSDLGWQPDPSHPELLGAQLIYYTSRFSGAPVDLARAVLGRSMLLHAALICGDLYTGKRMEAPYLLVGTAAEQEESAKDFFALFALQFGWHTHKILGQKRQYYDRFVPAIEAVERQIADGLGQLSAGHGQPQTIRGSIDRADELLQLAHLMKEATATNVANYQLLIEQLDAGNFFAGPGQRELFVERRRALELILDNMASDLRERQAALEKVCALPPLSAIAPDIAASRLVRHPALVQALHELARSQGIAAGPFMSFQNTQLGDLSARDIVGGNQLNITINAFYGDRAAPPEAAPGAAQVDAPSPPPSLE